MSHAFAAIAFTPNATVNDRVALILMDCAHRVRLKVLGRLNVAALSAEEAQARRLVVPDYRARPQHVITIAVEGFDWNCPQHIPVRIDAEEVQRALDERDRRIAELEALLARTPRTASP